VSWVLEGRVWNVGDDVQHDADMISIQVMRDAERDPEVLARMLFADRFPELTANARPGDVVVAGKRFAHGNPHNEGWIALRERGMGVVCRSIARGSYRNAIGAASRLLVGPAPLSEVAATGQGIRVDFAAGLVELDSGERFEYPPFPPELQQIVADGGMEPWIRARLAERSGA